MTLLWALLITFGRITTLLQVILYLPLTLDVAGQDAFLALSASLASYYFLLSSLRVCVHHTRFRWLGTFFATFQCLVVPACLLVVFNVYSPPSESYFAPRLRSADAEALGARGLAEGLFGARLGELVARCMEGVYWLARAVPPWWFTLLRLSSPVFSLLEGIATLLVIQVLGSLSRYIIAASLSSPPPPPSRRRLLSYLPSFGLGGAEGWQLLFLLLSAFVYVSGTVALWVAFEPATRNRPGAAAATGVAVSSTLWLTAIAFAVRKGNVIETSLMFGYVCWNVWQLADVLPFSDPLSIIRSFNPSPLAAGAPLPPLILASATALLDLLSHTLGHSARFLAAAGAALPPSVVVSLVYRLMVLYAASRILPVLKAAEGKWREQEEERVEEEEERTEVMDGLVKGKEKERTPRAQKPRDGKRRAAAKKEEREEPVGAFISIIVSYSRLLLIAVYSHLLLLDQSHMTIHRFLAVGTALTVWSFELVLGDQEEGLRGGSW